MVPCAALGQPRRTPRGRDTQNAARGNLSADVSAGAITTLPVFPLAASVASGAVLRLPDDTRMTTTATAALNATSISVPSVTVPAMKTGDLVYLA